MSQASEVELLMLDLINEERTSRGIDPLQINNDLNATAEDHSQWMLDNDIFSHTGVGGSRSGDRIAASDYDLEGNWRTAENIGWQSERGDPGIADDVADIHQNLMQSPGHRANILNPELEDIGIGVELGNFSGYDAVMITQNFGSTDAISETPEQDTAPIVMSENDAPAAPVEPPVAAAPIPEAEEPSDDAAPVAEAPTAPSDTVDDGEDDGPTVTTTTGGTTITNSSSAAVTATAGPDGTDVEIEGDGNFIGEGAATTGDDTVIETASGGSLTKTPDEEMPEVEGAPDEGGAAPTAPAFDIAALFEGIFDRFDFVDMPMMDDASEDMTVVRSFQGAISTPDGTFITDDRAAFDQMFMDVFAMSAWSCGENMDFV